MTGIIVAAASSNGIGDLVVGIVVGLCLGLLVGPAIRSWQTRREWIEASREARLTDRLLRRLEAEPDRPRARAHTTSTEPVTRSGEPTPREPWRTSR
ncbi:MAG TPA: hypothetical protein VFZ75_09325 [Actinomycetota bacterium]|nr:hypothetical protein [Actinomycetota bacterium]